MSEDEPVRAFVAVHIGAGYHSPSNSELYKEICRKACLQTMKLLKEKKSALEAVIAATMYLEDSPWTNAGIGSNLSVIGTVECDASVMDGKTLHYGAVGALSGIKNPVLVAHSLLQNQIKGTMSLGRVPPSTMVAEGAFEWAKNQNIQQMNMEEMITENSKRTFMKNKRKLDLLEEDFSSPSKREKVEELRNEVDATVHQNGDVLNDTVGAICLDGEGFLASAVSSGGIILKQSGRLGQAAMYGCGCWAENIDKESGIAVSTSGCGEQLSKTLLAYNCARTLSSSLSDSKEALTECMRNNFLNSKLLQDMAQPLGGVLAMRLVGHGGKESLQKNCEILFAHTTDSMCLAFMTSDDLQPLAKISRLGRGETAGSDLVVQKFDCLLGNKLLSNNDSLTNSQFNNHAN